MIVKNWFVKGLVIHFNANAVLYFEFRSELKKFLTLFNCGRITLPNSQVKTVKIHAPRTDIVITIFVNRRDLIVLFYPLLAW